MRIVSRYSTHPQPLGLSLLSVLLLAGCGSGSQTGRVPIRGTVEQGGKPVEAGSISFLPAEGHSGPAANGMISRGRYSFTNADGPAAGPHRVLIDVEPADINAGKAGLSAPAPTSPSAKSPTPDSTATPNRRKWEFQTVVPSESPYVRDFQLE